MDLGSLFYLPRAIHVLLDRTFKSSFRDPEALKDSCIVLIFLINLLKHHFAVVLVSQVFKFKYLIITIKKIDSIHPLGSLKSILMRPRQGTILKVSRTYTLSHYFLHHGGGALWGYQWIRTNIININSINFSALWFLTWNFSWECDLMWWPPLTLNLFWPSIHRIYATRDELT